MDLNAIVMLGSILFGLFAGWRIVRRWIRAAHDRAQSVNASASEGDVVMSRSRPVRDPKHAIVSNGATTATYQTQSVATAQNDRNELLLRNKAEALAAMVKAGIVGETKGIKIVYGCGPSSDPASLYQRARMMLKEELQRLDPGPQFRQEDGTQAPATYPISGRQN